jgi:ATP-binding cassette subfamily F protein 3
MQSVNILIQALDQYEGTYVVVSHDRYFVSQIANKIWYIEDEQIKEYPGTYDEYEWWQEERREKGLVSVRPAESAKTHPVPQPATNGLAPNGNGGLNGHAPGTNGRASEEERKDWQKTLKALTRQAEEAETEISRLESRKKKLEAELADPATYGDSRKMQAKNDEYKQVAQQLDKLQSQWETAMLEAEEWEKKLA